MRITRFVSILLIGVLLIPVACGSPPATTPPATTPPATTPPATTPPATTPPATTPPATTPPVTTPPAATPPANPTGPAAFVTSNLKITPRLVIGGIVMNETTVSVTVTNTGGQTGTYKVVMKVDDKKNPVVTTTKDVTLNGGEYKIVTFNLITQELGDHVIIIDNLSAEFFAQLVLS